MISQTAEYALRAMVHLAGAALNEGGAEFQLPQTAQQIGAATQVPVGYLSKVLQRLSAMDLITSQRGLGGGFKLARSPEEITIYEVLQAVDPLPRIRRCPLGLAAHSANLCPLHKRLDDAMAQVEQAFSASTLAEMVDGVSPFCEGKRVASVAIR